MDIKVILIKLLKIINKSLNNNCFFLNILKLLKQFLQFFVTFIINFPQLKENFQN